MKEREQFASRLGFILITAGCAIGLGNVYRFPIITGRYGGAIFLLIYLGFLVLLGLPVMCCELAVSRSSRCSIGGSFDALEGKHGKWHLWKYAGIGGNYLLMMCYTVITGWMILYFWKYLTGSISSITDPEEINMAFSTMAGSPWQCVIGAFAAVILGLAVCSLGLQKGVERVTKVMMLVLFVLMIGLAVYALTLSGAGAGVKFYLVPSVKNIEYVGLGKVINAAMGQAFFTLSLGMGNIAVFGSYIGRDRSIPGEAATIIGLDTFVALMSGLIIFPAYYTYNDTMIDGEGGPLFLFNTLTCIFNNMQAGRLIGTLFFLFMSFAAMSTVIAVFENIMSFWLEKTSLSRPAIALINVGAMLVLVLPAAFSSNIMANFTLFGMTVDTLEDFVVSNLIMPIGSLIYVLFCTNRYGWGWNKFLAEVNTGKGLKLARWLRPYMTFVLPLIIIVVLVLTLI